MSSYSQWEEAVTQRVAETSQITYSEAAGLVEGQPFALQQAWGLGLDANQTADKLLAEGV
ncbi:hypothetical protein [Stutzerimonas frequens]|jgi:hypothetical protein|uniref:hypothetical protein n=1 Tax=Stutzerimonas frequens TaxID=2968969 RepID=UPI000B4A3610|nr:MULTISPECIES: hypothetical protein [Pseudomonadaceae]MBF8164313.1 hypothetical protein [Pseudomonas mendocina]OWJ92286.1 hypothetical protein B6S59_20765 [Pseudomonas sp. A46]QTF59082.1 hypothetical protein J4H94_20930 [Stutzerimonas frequens]